MAVAPEPQRSLPGWPSSLTPLLTRADLPWLAFALLVAVGLRIAWVVYLNIDPNDGRFDDSVFYHNVANLLSMGVGYHDPWGHGETAQWPPAYPMTLAVLYKLFGWHLFLAKGLNIVIASATVILVYIVSKRLFDWRTAFAAAMVLAAFPGQIFFATLVYTETMFAMMFMLVLLLTLIWTIQQPDSRWWQVLLIGFMAGVVTMVRAEGVFLAIVMVVIWLLMVRPWRTVARYSALMVVGVVLAITPWTVRNAIQFHEFIPLRSNASDLIARQLDPDAGTQGESRTIRRGIQYHITHFWEIPGFLAGPTRDLYAEDADAIVLMQKHPAPGQTLESPQPLTDDTARRWSGLANRYFRVISLMALAGAGLCLLRRNRGSLVLIVAALGWTLLYANFNPLPRYHFPVGQIIAIFAAVFFIFAWDTARQYIARVAGKRTTRASNASGDGPL
ncbi:MAG: glycosyltransferase family 39 protein [Chloroflexi bacterium]|nr:glycosyltransferase family 39 protein [Chloroflexota bacterium]